jgi:hypothetical protein
MENGQIFMISPQILTFLKFSVQKQPFTENDFIILAYLIEPQ